MEHEGKTAIVTGGSRGIGQEICNAFLRSGANVINLDLASSAEDCINNENPALLNLKFDLSKLDEIPNLLLDLRKNYKICFLVNNARFRNKCSLEDENPITFENTLTIGLSAPFFLAQSFIEVCEFYSSIVNICSVASILSTNEAPAYHAAKGGLLALTKYLAVMGGSKKVRVNAILPGLIVQEEHRARFNDPSNEHYRELALNYQPMGEVGSSSDVAETVMFLCSLKSKYLSGATIPVDGAGSVQEQFSMLMRNGSSH